MQRPGQRAEQPHADDVSATGARAARLAYAILDGTLVPIDRVANQKPYYSGNTAGTG